MALKQNALTYLPEIKISTPSGVDVSIESIKGALYTVAEMQKAEVVDGVYEGVVVACADPFNKAVWDITLAAGTYTLEFVSEEILNHLEGLPKNPALSARRPLDVEYVVNANTYTVRSALAALNFVDKLEDKVSFSGRAQGTVTVATAIAADTVTINGLIYTAVAGAKTDSTEFSIDGTDAVNAADLADSINTDERVGTLGDVSASANGNVVTLTSSLAGEAGNSVTLSSSGATLAVSGATFAGAGGNGTYLGMQLNGFTPFETFVWDVVKADNVYTLTPTAES